MKNKILDHFDEIKFFIVDYVALNHYVDYCLEKSLPTKIKGKTSSHHILPVAEKLPFASFGDLSKNPWNKAELSYYDHYYAHYLLQLAVNHMSISHAFCSMHCRDAALNRITEDDLINATNYEEAYVRRNRLISEHKKSLTFFEGQWITVAQKSSIIRTRNLSSENRLNSSIRMRGENNIVYTEGVIDSIRKTKSTKLIDGMTLDKYSAIRAAETMSRSYINDDGDETSIYKENGKKLSKHLNEPVALSDGTYTTVAKIKAREKGDKAILKGKFYILKNIFDPAYEEILPAIELRKISGDLENKTKDNFLGKSKFGQNHLTANGKAHLIGLYAEILPKDHL